jgi:phosphatidylglycerol---prolipoprotein diacylglyceryl transferase
MPPAFALAYIVVNLDPVLFRLGPLAVHWYGLAYVAAIALGLAVVQRWARRKGIKEEHLWPLALWTGVAGLVGGRLYFVIQQPNLFSGYLLQPLNIIAAWNGGMAFFGAIFAASATLFLLAPHYGLSRWLSLDGGALFAAVGQIVGRFGNLVNGDILGQALAPGPITVPAGVCAHAPCIASVGDRHFLPWAIIYLNPHSFAPLGVPFQPAPAYEMLANLVALAILWSLRYRLPNKLPGLFFTLYVALYAVGQFVVFFLRGSEPMTPFLGISVLKQAQWTAVFTFVAALVLAGVVRSFSRPWPDALSQKLPHIGGSMSGSMTNHSGASDRADGLGTGEHRRSVDVPAGHTLPPWTPTQATEGRLRNMFLVVPPPARSQPDEDE